MLVAQHRYYDVIYTKYVLQRVPRVPEKKTPQPNYRGADRGGHTKATIKLVIRHLLVSVRFPSYLPKYNFIVNTDHRLKDRHTRTY